MANTKPKRQTTRPGKRYIGVYFDDETGGRLDAAASRNSCSVSDIVRSLVKHGLEAKGVKR